MPDLLTIEQKICGAEPLREALGDNLASGVLKLQASCHPDRHPDKVQEATALYHRISVLAESIRDPKTISSPKHKYNTAGPFAVGDVSDLYFGWEGDKDFVLKISRVNGAHLMLEREYTVLSQIQSAAFNLEKEARAKGKRSMMTHYFPVIVETFPAKDSIQRRVNVFVASSGYYPLPVVVRRNLGLNVRHIVWIFKRTLLGLDFAHKLGIVHGAVLPQHILVSPETHGVMIVGWGHSVDEGSRVRTISKDFKSWYPPEVLEKKPAYSGTDTYMAAKCMLSALDGHSPKIESFLKACMLPGVNMRLNSGNAFEIWQDFNDLAQELFGRPQWAELTM